MGLDFVEFNDVAVTHSCLETHSVCWDWFSVDKTFCGDITNNSFKALDNSMTPVELLWDITGTDVVKENFASTFVTEISLSKVNFDWFLGCRALMRACADDWRAIFGDINCDGWRSLLRADHDGVAGMRRFPTMSGAWKKRFFCWCILNILGEMNSRCAVSSQTFSSLQPKLSNKFEVLLIR